MKHFLTSSIVSGLLFSGVSLGATSLSDIELAEVSGGGIDPQLNGQSLSQEQQQPENNSTGYTPNKPLQNNDGMELTPEFFAILQSEIDVKRERKVNLNGTSQQGAQALNLENVLSSDIVSTNNVFNGGNITLDEVTTGIEVNQINSLHQLHRTQGSLNSSIAGYRYETTTHLKNETESFDQKIYVSIDQHDQTTTLTMSENEWSAAVGKVNFAEQFIEGNKIITILEPETITLIAGGTIGVIVDGWWGDKYGAEASYTGLFLEGPSASVNNIRPFGSNDSDLLIGATLRLGNIDFGVFRAEGCVGICAEVTKDLGGLEILNLFEFLAKVNPVIDGVGFIKEGIILEGMGSVFDDELNLNTGFAFIGNGSLKVLEPSSIKVAGEFNLKVDAGLTFTLDLSGVDVSGLFGPWPRSWSWPDTAENDKDIIDLKIPFTLLDIKSPAIEGIIYDQSFEDKLIAKLGPGDVSASNDIEDIPTETEQDTSRIFDKDIIDIGDSTSSESYEHTVLTGGQMTGAEAELLALSEGSLSVDNSNRISLADGAQQNMRVFNGVNAVSSVAANAINISRLPTVTRGLSAVPQISMQQHNSFIQQR